MKRDFCVEFKIKTLRKKERKKERKKKRKIKSRSRIKAKQNEINRVNGLKSQVSLFLNILKNTIDFHRNLKLRSKRPFK